MPFCKIYFDGACKGNPSKIASIGYIIQGDKEKNKFGGLLETNIMHTNNQAEYIALIYGMQKALELGYTEAHIFGDSQLVIFQMTKKWKVHDEKMQELNSVAAHYAKQFEGIIFEHIPRELNSEADEMANKAIKQLYNK